MIEKKQRQRKIVLCIGKSEVYLADRIEEGGNTKAKCMEALECFHMVEALQANGRPEQEIQGAAIKSRKILEGRIEIIKMLTKGGDTSRGRAAKEIPPIEPPIAQEEEEEEIQIGDDFS